MSWIGKKPADAVQSAQALADGTVTPSKLSTGAPTWDVSGNVSTTGQLTSGGQFNAGGLVSLGSTGQIKFPATQNASSDANTLDDYEEGTWTPTINGGGGSATYSQRTGRYTKIGRVVTATFYIDFAKNTLTSSLGISGLPFAGAFNYELGSGRFNSSGAVASPGSGLVGLQLSSGNTFMDIYIGTPSGIASWDASTLDAGQDLIGTITYTTAT